MSVWVVIPSKPLLHAKSRLSPVLSPEERADLAESMLRRTLKTVMAVPQVAGVLVISRDSYVLSLARDMGAKTVQESGSPELNNALMRATRVLSSWRAGAVLVLPADLPLISAEDVTEIIRRGQRNRSVVIATDQNGDGTNALFVRPPGLFSYAYGPNSYGLHLNLARSVGATVKIYESPRINLDIDTPDDLKHYQYFVDNEEYGATPLISSDNIGN